jgi:hypothetical protein
LKGKREFGEDMQETVRNTEKKKKERKKAHPLKIISV